MILEITDENPDGKSVMDGTLKGFKKTNYSPTGKPPYGTEIEFSNGLGKVVIIATKHLIWHDDNTFSTKGIVDGIEIIKNDVIQENFNHSASHTPIGRDPFIGKKS